MRKHSNEFSLLIGIILYGLQRIVVDACIGGGSGGGGAVCCPAASSGCAPSVPICPSYGYSSYSAGGSYAAPQSSYPRPCTSGSCAPAASPCQSSGGCSGAAPCSSSSSSGCGGSSAPIAIIVPSIGQSPSYASSPIGGYARAVAPSYSAPVPAPPLPQSSYQGPAPQSYNAASPAQPQPSSYGGQIPQPGPEIESNYEDQHVAPPAPNYGEQPTQISPSSAPYSENTPAPPPPDYNTNEGNKQNYDNVPSSETPIQQSTKPNYDNNQHDYADEANTIGGSEPASVVPSPSKPDAEEATAVNCEDEELRKIVENALQKSQDNLDAARKIESEAAARFGGRFNSIVSNSEFAYVNWYGKRNCQLRVNNTHSLTWED